MKKKETIFEIIWFSLIILINIYAIIEWDTIKSNPYYLGLFRGLIYPWLAFITIRNFTS